MELVYCTVPWFTLSLVPMFVTTSYGILPQILNHLCIKYSVCDDDMCITGPSGGPREVFYCRVVLQILQVCWKLRKFMKLCGSHISAVYVFVSVVSKRLLFCYQNY